MKKKTIFIGLCLLLIVAFLTDIAVGSVALSMKQVTSVLLGNNQDVVLNEIVLNHRLPKALTALLTGAALSVAGVLMQTLFQNPLAGPDVLGITSGASLGVAILTLGTSVLPFWMIGGWGTVVAAVLGATLVLLMIFAVSFRIRHTVSLLIIGMMFGYFSGAIVTILQNMSNPDTLKLFITWTFGSLSSVGWEQMPVQASVCLIGLATAFMLTKSLNVLLLGTNYADSMGIDTRRARTLVILSTALLAGTSTAFTGPISFIGITIPHLARGLFRSSDHRIVLPASLLCGPIILLFCDVISQLPGIQGTLPINAVTALFGAPIIIWILMKNKG